MNIYTERIKQKSFYSPINSRIIKKSHEYRVLATLRYLFPEKFSTMILNDAPDLQDFTNNVGIEVTDAVSENDMNASRIFSELHKYNSREQKKKIEKIELCGYSYTQNNQIATIQATGIGNDEKLIFQKIIRKKMEKLQSYKSLFNRIGLSILLPEIPSTYAENHFQKWLSDVFKEYDSTFDFVYVISERFCNYYDSKNTTYVKTSIKKEDDLCLKKIGRMTAEGEISLADIEWQ